MNRTNPTFKEHAVIDQENIDFLDEMFSELFDFGEVHSGMDEVPDLDKQIARFGKPNR
jgi:hypothetical protein